LLIGASVSAGFVVLFGVVGGLIGVGASFIGDLLPWLGLVIGIGLVAAGAWLVGGGNIYQYTGFAARAAGSIGGVSNISVRGYFMFGLSYGAASLGCTLPVFLAVAGISVAGKSVASVVSNFFLFALGMGIVILALTLGIAFFKGTMVGLVRKALPYVTPFGSWLMVLAGAYLVFYWLTVGRGNLL
jgi:cytochrome c biogenesis protein CcdA